jgi:hypothetical protein
MADLTARTKTALDEVRTIILGAQVLLGFQFNFVFYQTYDRLPEWSRYIEAVALLLMATAIALLIAPPIFHRVIWGGEDSGWLYERISVMTRAALLPFAISLGLSLYVTIGRIAAPPVDILVGAAFGAAALFWWYGIGLSRRSSFGRREREMAAMERQETVRTPLHAKIEQMLTESRVIIPGAQALLGFQLAVVLTESFDRLPTLSKTVHAVSLGCMALAIVLLMAPAAYHRIVYSGFDAPEFHTTGSVMITVATVPLALGIAGDIYVVMTKVFESSTVGVAIAAATLAGYVGLWHVYPAIRRERG